MPRSTLLWLMLVGCGERGGEVRYLPGVPAPAPTRVEDVFDIGPYPVTVLLVAPAAPTEIERAQLEAVGESWLAILKDHPAPWRLGRLPVGAYENALPMGALQPTTRGLPWIDRDTADPESEILGFYEELPTSGTGGNYVDTLIAMDLEGFTIAHGQFLLFLIGEGPETSALTVGGAREASEWIMDHAGEGVHTNIAAMTLLQESTCGDDATHGNFSWLAGHLGGYTTDLCDPLNGPRVAESYGRDLVVQEFPLTERARPGTFAVRVDDPSTPVLREGVDFTYDPSHNWVDVLWMPPELSTVTIEYEID